MDLLIVGAASGVAALSGTGWVIYFRLAHRDIAGSLGTERAKAILAAQWARYYNYEAIKLRQRGDHVGSAKMVRNRVRRMRQARRLASKAMTLSLKLARSRSPGADGISGVA